MGRLRDIYLTKWFFVLFVAIIILYITSVFVPSLFFIANIALLSLFGLSILDALLVLTSRTPIQGQRVVGERLNLGDKEQILIIIENTSGQPLNFSLIEGYPVEMQERSATYSATLMPGKSVEFAYDFVPKKRGVVTFGKMFVIIRSMFFLTSRRVILDLENSLSVFPSVIQMRKYELMVFQNQKLSSGIKRIRRLGNNSEFEQIKNYVQGDDVRTINWKATSRKNELQVNQYQEEKAQQVYCIIDKSRNMQMEFKGMSMLDYAINSTLVFSNIALRKGDRAGLITYADKLGSLLAAEKSAGQMRRIQEALYNQKTLFNEGNFELLYQTIRRTIKSRSMLVLFTNFETEFAMRRAIPILRRLSQKHMLVVVFFENTELKELAFQNAGNMQQVYQAVIAEKMISVKSKIARELRQNGIQTVLSLPDELSINTINKYLELKAKGAI